MALTTTLVTAAAVGAGTAVKGHKMQKEAAKDQKKQLKQAKDAEASAAQEAAKKMAKKREAQAQGGYQSSLGGSQGLGA